MAGGLQGARLIETFTSEWDLSTKQYRAVMIGSADDKVIVTSQTNQEAFGVVQNKPSSGEAARVCIFGYCKGIAADTVTRGQHVAGDAKGFLAPRTTSGTVLGMAMQSVGSGSVFSLIVNPMNRVAA